jgi:hypothetical protein
MKSMTPHGTTGLERVKQSLNITPDHKVLHYESECDMMQCVDADKTHFLQFALTMMQHLISGAMLENEKVKILISTNDIIEHTGGREVNVCCAVTSDIQHMTLPSL